VLTIGEVSRMILRNLTTKMTHLLTGLDNQKPLLMLLKLGETKTYVNCFSQVKPKRLTRDLKKNPNHKK